MSEDQAKFQAAISAQSAGDYETAASLYGALHARGRSDYALLHNLGWVLYRLMRADEAEVFLRRAIDQAPEEIPPRVALSYVLKMQGRFREAQQGFLFALAREPGRTADLEALSEVRLAMGDFASGFRIHEYRKPRLETWAKNLPYPEWAGEDLAGKRLLVWREQGLGDQIMMARFLRLLNAAQVAYAGPRTLQRLFAPLGVDYLAIEDAPDLAGFDYWTLPHSIPGRLGVSLRDLPRPPYLAGSSRTSGGIGVVWRGNAQPHAHRTIPDELAPLLLNLPRSISLHPEDTGATDMKATADLVAGLDLVIAIDTSVAHLAGAMGKPVWILLPALHADWRWMAGRDDSPWYPSARLFRQRTHGDWIGVLTQVQAALGISI